MPAMKVCLLHLDDALKSQPGFMRACRGAREIDYDGDLIRLWGRPEHMDSLRRVLPGQGLAPWLTFIGSGDFHHVAAVLIEQFAEPITVVHFDNHPDWFGGMHCGGWVSQVALGRQVITVGPCSDDLQKPVPALRANVEMYSWAAMQSFGLAFVDYLLSRIESPRVYITVDKDVLRTTDAVTNWDQGQMSIQYLCLMIKAIRRDYKIVGADVCGDYSVPKYGVDVAAKRRYARREQSKVQPDADYATIANDKANRALLQAFTKGF